MLTSEDIPTIRFALRRRLDLEPGAYVFEPILVQPFAKGDKFMDSDTGEVRVAGEPFIRVCVYTRLEDGEDGIPVLSKFDLPDPFEHGHLLNEIDEIAESLKLVRRKVTTAPLLALVQKVSGTGMRGNWSRYGTLMGRHG